MKRLIACVLMLALCLSVFAACDTETADPLTDAKNYIYNTYKNSSEVYVADYKVIGKVVVGDLTFDIAWSTDASEENVKIVPGDDGMVTIDINETNPEEVSYTLTATIKDAEGNTETVTFNRRTPGAVIIDDGMSYEEIVEAAYKLEPGIAMDGTHRLYGTITSVDTAWSEDYQNITVTIQVGDMTDKPIMCFRLKGDGAKDLAVGDTITVEGTLKNYEGTIEFDAGCQLIAVGAEAKDQSAILDAAYKLEVGIAMTEPCTLTGVISAVNTAWSEDYQNITVTIVCDGDTERPIQCFRLKGDGAKELAVGDTITVTGTLKNYEGTIEFDAGCNLDKVVKGESADTGSTEAPADPAEIVNAAYALEDGAVLPYTATLTGVITTVDTPYSEQYSNVTVTIQVGDMTDKLIMCFRLKGDGADKLAVGDTITVTGSIKNYGGTIEFDAGCTLDSVVAGGGEVPVAPEDPAEIVNAGYALADGESLPYNATLTGVITSIDTEWSDEYNNITVTIVIGDMTDKPIQCFRLKGDGAADLAVGDTITVTGVIKNYGGKIEFNSGCTLDSVTKVEAAALYASSVATAAETTQTPTEIVDAAYALESGAALEASATLTGVISSVDTPYSESYKNITVTIKVEGRENKPIQCFRLKGDGAADLAVGDTITVTGTLKNYNGTIEFDAGCTLDKVVKGEGEVPVAPEDPKEIVDAAYELEGGASLPYNATLTGVITKIGTAYSEQYKNITVTIAVEGRENKPIVCFRLKGEGAETLEVGDTITVTGTIKNYVKNEDSTIEFDSGCTLDNVVKPVKAPEDPKEIVDAAYALEDGETLPYSATLTGVITSVDTPYSESYKNITVTIAVEGRENKTIQCFRLKGEGADTLAVGDTITVTGEIKNYKGTIEFDAGCALDKVVKGEAEAPVAPEDPKEIVDSAYALEKGASLPYSATLVGEIISVDTPYSESYKNITVSIAIEGREDKPIVCFRLKGEGAETLAAGDTITVTGIIKNYNGTIEFDSGCTLDKVVKGEAEAPVAPEDPKEIIDAAYALESGESLPYNAELTGKVTEIVTEYSEQYGNITVKIVIEGCEDQPIVCFRLKGDGADKLAVGDTVTVSGQLMNYNGTVEFGSGCSLLDVESSSPQTGFVEVTAIIAIMLIAGAAIIMLKKKSY